MYNFLTVAMWMPLRLDSLKSHPCTILDDHGFKRPQMISQRMFLTCHDEQSSTIQDSLTKRENRHPIGVVFFVEGENTSLFDIVEFHVHTTNGCIAVAMVAPMLI